MADKLLVLTKPNVCAVLERRKFQRRRIINRIPPHYVMGKKPQSYNPNDYAFLDQADPIGTYPTLAEPRFQVGDRAYVAEGYQIEQYTFRRNCVGGKYLADNKEFWTEVYQREYDLIKNRKFPLRPTPGRFMYKSLARIFLPIVEVRVERLQDISEEDAIAEGVQDVVTCGMDGWKYYMSGKHSKIIQATTVCKTAKRSFQSLWDLIHGKGAWDLNLWVEVDIWDEIIIKGE